MATVFRIRSVPRFPKDEFDVRWYDSVVAQRALWHTLLFQLVQKHRASIELRLEAAGIDEPLRVALIVHGDPNAQALRQVEALLPADYSWEVDTSGDGGSLEQPVRIARIIRRIEYLDLPATSSLLLRASMTSAPQVPVTSLMAAPASGAASGAPPTTGAPGSLASLMFGLAAGRQGLRRELPAVTATFAELHSRRFCLPLPGPTDEFQPRQKALYEALQRSGGAAISLCVHPVDSTQLEPARTLALNWKRFLDPFASELESSGFSPMRSLRETFDRFSLPEPYLVSVSARVAASTDESAIGMANMIAASLGGARAFRIEPPTRDSSPGILARPDLDIPCQEWDEAKRNAFRKHAGRQLHEHGVLVPEDPAQLDFILLLPHIFTAEEAERTLRLPAADEEGLPGLDSRLVPPFTVPSLRFQPVLSSPERMSAPEPRRVRLGMIRRTRASATASDASLRRFDSLAWHTMPAENLTKHALVVGSTGSGKTMTTLFLTRELARVGVPLMVIEPVKTEYYSRLNGRPGKVYRLCLEGNDKGEPAPDFLAFDPLRIQEGVTVARHASCLKSSFEAAFPLDPVSALVLENGLLEYYLAPPPHGCGLKKFSRGGPQICRVDGQDVFPSFATFRKFFIDIFLPREFPPGTGSNSAQRTRDVQDIFRRRFANLGDGLVGEAFRKADRLTRADPARRYDTFGRYLNVNTVVELDGVPDPEHKSLLMALLLVYVFERRQSEDLQARERGATLPATLRHMLIVEEAHRVLSAHTGGARGGDYTGETSKAKAVGLFVDMLAEIRAFGQGLTIVEQIPTKIVPEAVKNTNLKIMLRLTSKEDRDYLGEAMSFTESQKRFVTHLRADRDDGIGFVVFEEGIDRPLMLTLPLPREHAPNWLYDEFYPNVEENRDGPE